MVTWKIGIIFHGIGTPCRALETDEAPYWVGVDRFEALLDAITIAPERYCITFDDGNLSDHAIALPRLRARGLRAQFFVLTGRIGQPGSLGPNEITELQAEGMEIGSHGVEHRDWRQLDAASLRAELKESKAVLESLCKHPITAAGIPFGSWDAHVLRALRRAGYKSAWTSDGGQMRPDAFLRPRRSVRGDMDGKAMRDLLSGQMGPLHALRRGVRIALRRVI